MIASTVLLPFILGTAHLLRTAEAHGFLVSPPSRNARDGVLPEFAHSAFPEGTYGCSCGNNSGVGCELEAGLRGNGQPCLWFSQGCTIGCATCDNATQHSMGRSLCNSTMAPTLPKRAWTMNRWAEPGSVNDTYRQHPWRAPGSAPIVDACGMAGGAHHGWGPHPGAGASTFHNSSIAKMGDMGSVVLKQGPSEATWTAGTTATVSWGIRANHGPSRFSRTSLFQIEHAALHS